MTHSIMVLDENKHIKYTFPTPKDPERPKKELDFVLKEGTQVLELFDESSVNYLHFLLFVKGNIKISCEDGDPPSFTKIRTVLPCLKFDKPIEQEMKIKITFQDKK